MNSISSKPPIWFWIISVVALLWNAMGVMAYLNEKYNSEGMLEQLTEAQKELFYARPAWVTAAFAIAVFVGLIACTGLLLRKKWARLLFILSLLGALAQNLWYYVLSGNDDMSSAGLSIAVIAISIFLAWFAGKGISKGWLR